MSEMTLQRWEELKAKLDTELAAADVELHAARKRFNGALVICAVIFAVFMAGVVVGVIMLPEHRHFVAAPLGMVVACLGFALVRANRGVKVADAEKQRIDHDIRAWKKRKPGGVHARKQEPGAQTTG